MEQKIKGKPGRPLKYTPEEMQQKFLEYIESNKTNIFYRNELIKSGERAGEIIAVPVQAPLTIVGFCVFLGINKVTFYELLENKDKGFSNILYACKDYIEQNQLAGAAAGVFNPMIVARLIGLADKQQHEVSAPDKITIDLNNNNIDLSK